MHIYDLCCDLVENNSQYVLNNVQMCVRLLAFLQHNSALFRLVHTLVSALRNEAFDTDTEEGRHMRDRCLNIILTLKVHSHNRYINF